MLAACGDLAGPAPAATAPDPSASLVVPTFSFAPDPGLASRFPTVVDGKPVTDLRTGFFADVIGQLGAPEETLGRLAQSLKGVGIDLATLSFGSAIVSVDDESVRLQALRTPNADGNVMLRNYPVFVDAFSDAFGNSPAPGPITSVVTLGGRPATVVTYSDGNRTVLCVSGDTMFIIDNATDTQNATILQALP